MGAGEDKRSKTMTKYRFLVLYTFGESERNEFLTKIQEKYPSTETLHDQSSLAIMEPDYYRVVQFLEEICKEFNKDEKGHFVTLFYPNACLYPNDTDNAYICENVIWESNN